MSLFKKIEPKSKRLKMYIYGPTGTGKTVTSLHFPNVALIDTEKGTEHYGQFFPDVMRLETNDIAQIHSALDELLTDPQGIKTVVLDSMSDVYDAIMKGREDFMKKKTGNARYELVPKDYQFIKRDVKLLLNKLLALDMNIVATARSKDVYDPGEFMKKIGTTAEGHKDIPYRFDVVLELSVDSTGKRIAKVDKDRTNRLPHEFEFDFKQFSQYLDMEEIERDSVVFKQKAAFDELNNRTFEVQFNGTTMKTAGVTADSLHQLSKLLEGKDEAQMKLLLRDLFGVESILDLTENEATALIKELTQEQK